MSFLYNLIASSLETYLSSLNLAPSSPNLAPSSPGIKSFSSLFQNFGIFRESHANKSTIASVNNISA